jgi:hypothetical protein
MVLWYSVAEDGVADPSRNSRMDCLEIGDLFAGSPLGARMEWW